MSSTVLRRSSVPAAIAAALLAAALILIPAMRASAHDSLISSDPAADSTVDALPDEVSLTFSAALIEAPNSTAIVVTDADGKSLGDGDAEITGAIVTQKLRTEGAAPGEYTVLWQVVSSDGHPTDGTFTFTVAGDTSAEPAPVESESVDASAAPDDVASTAPPAEDPNMTSGFSVSAPWLIGGAAVLLIAIFLLIVWIRARGRRSVDGADSDAPAEG